MFQIFDKTIAVGLLVTIAFTTLAHGAVEAWSAAIFESLILILLLLWAIKIVFQRRIEIRVPMTALPLAALLGYAILQSAVFVNADGQKTSLSIDAEATRGAATILFFLLAAHVLAANFFTTRERFRMLANFLIVFGLAFAVFALLQHFTWNGSFFWLRATRAGGGEMVTGSFVNHNHFAGLMELLIPLPVALVLANVVRNRRVLYALAAAMMTLAAVMSLSRGGMISLAVGGAFVFAVAVYKTSRENYSERFFEQEIDEADAANRLPWFFNLAGAAVVVLAIALGTLLIGSEPLLNRITNNSVVQSSEQAQNFDNARGWMWRNSWAIFRANPIFGIGFGAFETAFPNYSDGDGIRQYGKQFIFDRAHNDYLQILTDTGLIGAGLAAWFVVALLISVRRALHLRNAFGGALAIGWSAAVVALAVHSFFDFNLQLPAIALIFLIVAAAISNLPLLDIRNRWSEPQPTMLPPGREIKLLQAAPEIEIEEVVSAL